MPFLSVEYAKSNMKHNDKIKEGLEKITDALDQHKEVENEEEES